MTGDPMDAPRCTAKAKTTGQRCKRRPVPGGSVCVKHGGGAPQVRAAAERAQQQAQATELAARLLWNPAADPVTDPISQLQLLAGQMRQAVDMLGAMLGPGDPCGSCGRGPMPLDSPAGVAWMRQQRELRQLLADMGRLGIASRAIEVQQGQAEQMLAWLRDGLEAGAAAGVPATVLQVVLDAFLDSMRRSRAGVVAAAALEAGSGATS